MLATERAYLAPGAFDGLSAKLIAAAGFELVYASGGATSRASGYPDMGILSFGEVLAKLAPIVDAVDLPVIADADTGYGNALNARRAVREFERLGVAGIHIEDQTFPKRCGHYDDKTIVTRPEMVQKIKAARDAVHDQDLVLIARTDALAIEGLAGAIERANAYLEAGADVIFIEAPTSEAEIAAIADAIAAPKLINMFQGGKTPLVPLDRLHALGYRLVIVPSDLQRAAIHAMTATLVALKRDGHSAAVADRMVSFQDRERVIGTAAYMALDARYGG